MIHDREGGKKGGEYSVVTFFFPKKETVVPIINLVVGEIPELLASQHRLDERKIDYFWSG